MQTGIPQQVELTGNLGKAKDKPFWMIMSLLKDEKGEPTAIVTVTRDITELKKTEEALRASEARYRTYIEVTGQIGWTTPADGVVDDVPEWRKYTGQSKEEIKGWGWLNAIHPDDREHTSEIWKKAVAAKSAYETEYRIRRHDGIYRYFLARGIPSLREDGTIREWVGTCIDITERKQMEEILRKQNKVLIELTDPAAWMAEDLKTVFAKITEVAARILQVERVSVWLFNKDGSMLCCQDLFELSKNTHSSGIELPLAKYPAYFEAVKKERVVPADNARDDPRTSEYRDSYLIPLGITSMMDVPLNVGGKLLGVLCHEHIGPLRHWSFEEQNFAISVANLLSQEIMSTERKKMEIELKKKIYDLETFHKAAVGRELRMAELKKRIAELEKQLSEKS